VNSSGENLEERTAIMATVETPARVYGPLLSLNESATKHSCEIES
jgi:hypothetical protein